MIEEIIEKIDLHRNRAKKALEELESFELNKELFEDFEKVKVVDTFIFRFTKFQDMLGDKFFRAFLKELGEYKDEFSFLDVLDKLEKLRFIEDSTKLREYRRLRNELAHEYPSNEEYIIEGIEKAKEAFKDLDELFERMVNYYKTRIKGV